jgi:hypothetical protein
MLGNDKVHAESGGRGKAKSSQGSRSGVQRRMTHPKRLMPKDLDLIRAVMWVISGPTKKE